MVYECRQTVRIPIIGIGGIADARDALEFMIAGASAVQVGTASFVDPFIWPKLLAGICEYMERHRIARVGDLVGTVDTSPRESKPRETRPMASETNGDAWQRGATGSSRGTTGGQAPPEST
jgi:tRNA-dihydrouridine synthase